MYVCIYVQTSTGTAATMEAATKVRLPRNSLYSQAATAAEEDAFSRKAVAASMAATFRYHADIS